MITDVALSQLDKGVWCRLRAGSDSSCFSLAPEQKERKKKAKKWTRHMLASFASVQINVKTQYKIYSSHPQVTLMIPYALYITRDHN